MKYQVLVTSDATAHAYVTVNARTPREAERKALEKAKDGVAWTLDDNYFEPYICDPGNCVELIESEAK